MKQAISILMLLLIAIPATAQDDAGKTGKAADAEKLTLQLKSGAKLEGTLTRVTEEGTTLDLGDGASLYVRWVFIRGDKHFELRRRATDYKQVASIVRLADFCHENAMDAEEAYVLAAALKLEPGNDTLRARLSALPKPEGLEVPAEPRPEQPKPENPEPEPAPETPKPEPLPPPLSPPPRVLIEMAREDAAAINWMADEFKKVNYPIGTRRDHDVVLKLEISFKLTANPTFMGAELYAIYDGTLKYELTKKGEKKTFANATVESLQIRRNTKAEAIKACRNDLLQQSFTVIYVDLESRR